MKRVYSGYVGQDDGFNGPVPFDGPHGWTVDKMGQTEIFKIHHGLNLKRPHDLRVVVTTTQSMTVANVESVTADDFTVTVWNVNATPAMTGFYFLAVNK